MIKNIVFDIGNVLVRFQPDEAMREIGIEENKIAALAHATYENPIWVPIMLHSINFEYDLYIAESFISLLPNMRIYRHFIRDNHSDEKKIPLAINCDIFKHYNTPLL